MPMPKPTAHEREAARNATALIVGALCFAVRSSEQRGRSAMEEAAHCIALGQAFACAAQQQGCGAMEIMEAVQGGEK